MIRRAQGIVIVTAVLWMVGLAASPARGQAPAATALLRASADPLVRERLIELVNIETHAVVRVGWTAHTDRHRADWTPILDAAGARVSYGHDIENINTPGSSAGARVDRWCA